MTIDDMTTEQTAMIETPAGQMAMFDYGELAAAERPVIERRTEDIKARMRRAAEDVVEIGRGLLDVKARLNHGQWGRWLATEFAWSDQTASNFMNVALRMGDIPNGLEFAPKVLYTLSAPSVPEAARQQAVERAKAGETITPAVAKQIVTETKAQAAPTVAQAAMSVSVARDEEPEEGEFEVDEPVLQPMPPEVSSKLGLALGPLAAQGAAPAAPDQEIAAVPAARANDQALLEAGALCRLVDALQREANAAYERLAGHDERVVQIDQGTVAQIARSFMANSGLKFQVAMLAGSARLVEE